MKKNTILSFLLPLLLLGSCKKFVDISGPPTLIDQTYVFADESTATSAVAGLYYLLAQANATMFNGGITVYTGLSSDELFNTSTNADYDAFRTNNLTSSIATLNNSPFWAFLYSYIFQANAVIEGIGQSSIARPAKDRLTGEMLFIRSLTYFYLVNLYGDVPLVLTTRFVQNELMPRTARTKVWEQVTDDLLQAVQLLPDDYPTATRLRVNKQAAMALLARAYLYRQQWGQAITTTTSVIGDNRYQLENLSSVFLAASHEALLQFSTPNTSTSVTWDASVFIPSSATSRPGFALADTLVHSFESGDARFINWTAVRTVSGTAYRYVNKYKTRTTTAGGTKPEYIMVLRLAEQYLIRAEAYAQQDQLAAAIADLDMIRRRAGLPKIADTQPGITKQALLKVIAHENQIEFFAEWGHRWFDLKRTGSIDAVLSGIKSGWQPYKALYPIPSSQMRDNPSLTQNPGYN